jgi:hypothetical protein
VDDTTANYRQIRELVASCHEQYGDDVTFIPGGYFVNACNTVEQVNRDLHEGLARASEIAGNGFRPQSVVAGFLAAPNLQYLAEKEDIHVCRRDFRTAAPRRAFRRANSDVSHLFCNFAVNFE